MVASPVPYTFVPNTTVASAQVNADFAAVISDINALPPPQSLVGFRNRIINGAMIIDQRSSGALIASLASLTFVADRFVYVATASAKFSSQIKAGAVTPPVGFSSYIGLTSLASTALGSTDNYQFVQRIEGFNVQDFNFGTASAVSTSLSFWVYSSLTGTFAGSILNSAANRSYVFVYTIGSANTWTNITIPNIPGDVTGTWLTTSGIGIAVQFSLGCGSDYQTTPGTWQGGTYLGTNTSVSVVSTSAATFYITGIQFEPGAVCTAFENRMYPTELQMAQRYFQWIYYALQFAASGAGVTLGQTVTFPVTMRAIPTMNAITADPNQVQTNINNSSNSFTTLTPYGAQLYGVALGAGQFNVSGYRSAAQAEI